MSITTYNVESQVINQRDKELAKISEIIAYVKIRLRKIEITIIIFSSTSLFWVNVNIPKTTNITPKISFVTCRILLRIPYAKE